MIELIERERSVRDASEWAEMAACYHPDSTVEVSWFKGSGADFVGLSRKNFPSPGTSLHQLGQSVVKLRNNRATVETPFQVIGIAELEGTSVTLVNFARLFWRVQRRDAQWLIDRIRVVYIRDLLIPCNPRSVPDIDEAELAQYRPPYRFLSYVFARSEHPVSNDLPGIDRPEMVRALQDTEALWLIEA